MASTGTDSHSPPLPFQWRRGREFSRIDSAIASPTGDWTTQRITNATQIATPTMPKSGTSWCSTSTFAGGGTVITCPYETMTIPASARRLDQALFLGLGQHPLGKIYTFRQFRHLLAQILD